MKKIFAILLALSASLLIVLTWYQSKKNASTQDASELTQQEKEEIIEEALNLELPAPNTITSEEATHIVKAAFRKVEKGNYEQAIRIALDGLKMIPTNFDLQAELASLLGDCAEVSSPADKEKMMARSKSLFNQLLKEADKQPKEIFYPFKNEYYFRFGMYREQYELGATRVADYWGSDQWKTQGYRGYYSQGVGAARYAKELLEQGNKSLALDYAQKAVVAWAQYFSYRNDYYNAYVHYALALGILGYKEEMMRALRLSDTFINKGMDYYEFREVIEFIEQIK